MFQAHEGPVHSDLDAQLLPDLPPQTLLQRFPRLLFSAGKFPQPAQEPAVGTLGDQKTLSSPDNPGGDIVMGPGGMGRKVW